MARDRGTSRHIRQILSIPSKQSSGKTAEHWQQRRIILSSESIASAGAKVEGDHQQVRIFRSWRRTATDSLSRLHQS